MLLRVPLDRLLGSYLRSRLAARNLRCNVSMWWHRPSTELGLVDLILIVKLPHYPGRGRRGLVPVLVGEKLKELLRLNLLPGLLSRGVLVVIYGSGIW